MSAQGQGEPDERAPSLAHNEGVFPFILSAARRLPPAGHLELTRADLAATHSASAIRPLRTEAFHLLLVLHLLAPEKKDISPSIRENTLDAFQDLQKRERRRKHLRELACEILECIPQAIEDEANQGNPESAHVEDILLARFRIDNLSSRMIRVIDLLVHPEVPPELLNHPIITMPLVRIWKYGASRPFDPSQPVFRRLLAIYDSTSAPRNMHALQVAWHLLYLILLMHLILYPSPIPILVKAPGGPIGIREPIIAVYNISNILFIPGSFSSLPHILVLISFIFALPASPSPETTPYLILLPAFCLSLLFMHFPVFPTPLLLVEPVRSLPLSSLYVGFFTRCLFPALLFFLPLILISTVLLSFSLAETLPRIFQTITVLSAAPPSARIAFLGLSSLSVILFAMLAASILILSPASLYNADNASGYWERYGAAPGVEARRALVRAIITYSPSPSRNRYPVFPPPFNIVALLPASLSFPQKIGKAVWRVLVGPFALLIASLWGWGLF